MNKAIITGVVRDDKGVPESGAVVRLFSIKSGNFQVYNTNGVKGMPNFVYSDKNGRYQIKFLWEGADIGTAIGTVQFKVLALHGHNKKLPSHTSSFGYGLGKLFTVPDASHIAGTIVPSLSLSDAADLKGYKFAGAFNTILTPKLSVIQMASFGFANIWIDGIERIK